MALKVAEVLIKWRGEGAQQIEADTRKMGSALTDLGNKAKSAGAVLSAGLTAPLVLIGKQAVDAASDLNESMSAVETVFGSTADQVMNFSRTAASQLGQSRQAALGSAAALGALFKGVGLGEQQMADFSGSLLTAAADLGSFYNVDPGQALDKLRSGLVGEAEGLRTFGILLNESAVQAKGLELGLADANGELSEGAKVQARYALIMEQVGAAQGDFARTSDGLANSQRILAARMQDVTAEIGQKLLPYALKAATAFSGLLDWFSGLSDNAKGLAVAIGAVAAAAGPVLIIAGQLASSIGALQPVLAALLGPVGLVVAAVVGLGLAFKNNWFGIRDLVTGVVERIGNTLGRMIQFFQRAKERGLNPFRLALRTLIVTLGEKLGPDHPFVEFLQKVLRFGERLKAAFDAEGLSGVIDEIVKAVGKIDWESIKNTLTTQGGEIIGSLQHGMQDFWNNTLSPWLHGVLDGIPGLLDGAGTWLTTSGADIVTGLLHGMQDVWNNDLGPWLHGVIDGIPGLFDAAGTWLDTSGVEIITGLLHGMQDFWNNHLSVWLHGVIDGIPGLFDAAYDWLQEPGSKLIDGFRHGAQDLWNNNVGPWLDGRKQAILDRFSEAGTWLLEQGKSILQGLLDGIVERFVSVATFFQNIGTSITGALPKDWGTLLYDTGMTLIQGLWDGAQAKWTEFTDWLGGLTVNLPGIGGGEKGSGKGGDSGGGGGGEFRAMGGPLGKRFTVVGEYGPELLINRSLVMPHGAAQSRVQAMGGMAYGGTGNWGEWLAAQDAATRKYVRSLRASGQLNAAMRNSLMGRNSVQAIEARARERHNRRSDFANRANAYGDATGDYSGAGRRALRQHERNSDALNRANAYGDRTGDYRRADRVMAREARSGRLQDGGLSRQERQYMINNYGSITVQAKDSNVARAIGDQLSSRDR